jgi:hypothetical protein
MRSMTKSPLALAREAYQLGQAALEPYSGKYSPHRFTQAQLFAILVLRQFFKTDYRGVIQMIREFAELRRILQLQHIPHYSTLCYAERRLLKKGLLKTC